MCSSQRTDRAERCHHPSPNRIDNPFWHHYVADEMKHQQQATMTKSSFPRTLHFTSALRALSPLLLLLPHVSAFATHLDQHLCFVRSAGGFKKAMTAKWMVSTLASDWDIAEPSDEQTSSALLRHRSDLKLSARNNHVIAADIMQQRMTPELELPRHTTAGHSGSRSVTEITEMTMGRVAMVTAFILVANELLTGQSLPDQISTFVTTLMMST